MLTSTQLERAATMSTTTIIVKSDCRKFAPNIFNKNKCAACFKAKEEHSDEALENNRVTWCVTRTPTFHVRQGSLLSLMMVSCRRPRLFDSDDVIPTSHYHYAIASRTVHVCWMSRVFQSRVWMALNVLFFPFLLFVMLKTFFSF